MNGCSCVPRTLYLWIQKFEFHLIFYFAQNIILLIFPQLFKSVKIIFTLWAVQKQMGTDLAYSL